MQKKSRFWRPTEVIKYFYVQLQVSKVWPGPSVLGNVQRPDSDLYPKSTPNVAVWDSLIWAIGLYYITIKLAWEDVTRNGSTVDHKSGFVNVFSTWLLITLSQGTADVCGIRKIGFLSSLKQVLKVLCSTVS